MVGGVRPASCCGVARVTDFDDLLGAITGKHRCSFIAEDGEFGCVCICGWTYRTTKKDTDVEKMVSLTVLAALVHTEPPKDTSDTP